MMHKIREAMANDNSTKELFKSMVEIEMLCHIFYVKLYKRKIA